jgi:hypothetical protein
MPLHSGKGWAVVVLLAVVLGLVLLYLWLSGHWFGRALAFIVWGGLAILFACAFGNHPPLAFIIGLVGLLAAWLAALAPSRLRAGRKAGAGFGD